MRPRVVETDLQRLRDDGFGEDLLEFEAIGDFETLGGFGGRERARLILINVSARFFFGGEEWKIERPENAVAKKRAKLRQLEIFRRAERRV
jgi:hypothetical protein